jgi:hypothetical protein
MREVGKGSYEAQSQVLPVSEESQGVGRAVEAVFARPPLLSFVDSRSSSRLSLALLLEHTTSTTMGCGSSTIAVDHEAEARKYVKSFFQADSAR